MSSRATLGIWLVIGFFGSFVFTWGLTLLNVNALDPTLGDDGYTATYRTEGAFPHSTVAEGGQEFEVDTREGGGSVAGARMLRYAGSAGDASATIRPDGTLAEGVYPLVWVHLKNPITNFGSRAWSARVRDDAGLIGEPGGEYEVRDLGTFIWWDHVLSSQASHRAAIYDGEQRVASAVYDATCGLLFNLTTHRDGYGYLRLMKTDFPISRNRYKIGIWVLMFAAVIILVYYRKSRSAPEERRAVARDRFHLAVAIATTVVVDFAYDTWFFHVFGDWFTVLLHLAVFLVWWRYFGFWALGLLLEIAWPLTFGWFAARSVVPGITYFPAMLITLMLMLLMRPTPGKKA